MIATVIFSKGRIIESTGIRKEKKKADYILSYEGMSIAVLESKD
jgi:hypothetical protein